ncbi:hypothetical protein CRD17_10285 [Corynebacterium sp. LK30]|uniref:hypothetical protein n=1 Tax=Corynebacterium sp. LK30 TaxID=2044577 RepID=UPI001652A3BF|nr:hypothetical protein [Corynebacterium sp. LK30]MBC6807585.1 hypothetical protein [Corynebacterium sp. LK30]
MSDFFDRFQESQQETEFVAVPDTAEDLLRLTSEVGDEAQSEEEDPVERFVSDLSRARAAVDALDVPADGGAFVRSPGTGLVPEKEVRDTIERLGGHIPAGASWVGSVTRLEVTSEHLLLEIEGQDRVAAGRALRASGIPNVASSGVAEGDFAGALAYRLLSTAVPQLIDLYCGTEEHWGRTWHRLGLSEVSRRQDSSETITIPNPVGFRLLPDGRGCMLLRTPVTKPLKAWESKLSAIRAKMKRQVDLVDIAPNIVGLASPAKPQELTPWIPTASEQLHIAAPSPGAFVAGALAAYPHMAWVQGRAADGQILSQPMARVPHAMVGGGKGSGKSTWASWLATSCALAGADLIICDGKGSSDYVGLVQALPNVLMYTSCDAEHVRALQWIHAEMDSRYCQQKTAATHGEAYEPRPIVLLFDEFGAFVEGISDKAHPQNAGWEGVQAQLTQVLQKARAVRIHCVFVSQTLYASTFPGKMRGNVQCRLSLGVPESHTLQIVAGDVYDEAKSLSAQIPRGRPGQGVAVTTGSDGEATARRVAIPFGFVPGRKAPNRITRDAWGTLQPAYEAIPALTPRIAPVFDAPVQPAGRKKDDELPSDWHAYACQELAQLPWVRVGATDLAGPPLPESARYDSLSSAYAGDDTPDDNTYTTYH